MLAEVVERADRLAPDEQLRLLAHLAERARRVLLSKPPRRKWREIRGLAAHPMCGEDAQQWVSRSRREDDELREARLGRTA
jgi:prephenate dehydratase